jgi:hypothetical protein
MSSNRASYLSFHSVIEQIILGPCHFPRKRLVICTRTLREVESHASAKDLATERVAPMGKVTLIRLASAMSYREFPLVMDWPT